MTSFEELITNRSKFARVNVDEELFRIVIRASNFCPRLHQLLLQGIGESMIEERIIRPITTKVRRDVVHRFWSYNGFETDFMLAQQFNYEILILD